MPDQYPFTNPVTRYRQDGFPEQKQDEPGLDAELSPAYVYLASAESGYVGGETLNVNGGMPTP